MEEEVIDEWPINGYVAATSVGINQNEPIMDLCYEEDSTAEVDMNIVMTDKGEIVEIQGTGRNAPLPGMNSRSSWHWEKTACIN